MAGLIVVALLGGRLADTARPSGISEIGAAGEGGAFEAYRYPADFNAIAAEAIAASFQASETTREDCREDDQTRDFALCLGHAYGNLTLAVGPEEALRLVTIAMRDTNSGESAHCHMIVHTIGVAAYQRAEKNVGPAFAAGTPVCVNGYYHGVISAHMQTLGLDPKDESEQAVEVVAEICGESAISSADPDGTACLHGLGHAMMNHTLYNLPFAIAVCDKVKAEADMSADPQAYHRFYMCSDGSFHENFNAPAAGMPTTWLSYDDPLYPCNAVPDRFQPSCYVNVYLQLQRVAQYDFVKMIPYCPQVDTEIGRNNFDLCVIGWAVGYTSGGGGYAGGESIAEGCALLPEQWFIQCTTTVAAAITAQFPERVIGIAMCPAIADESLRRTCFDGVYPAMKERGSGNVRCGEVADLTERRRCAAAAAGPGQSTELP
jgi:hypothetical protein